MITSGNQALLQKEEAAVAQLSFNRFRWKGRTRNRPAGQGNDCDDDGAFLFVAERVFG